LGRVCVALLGVALVGAARRRAEASAHAARDDAERANRAKSEFLSNMSHELRTPLNSVIGFANVILKNKAGNLRPQDVAYLGRIVANGRHLLGLINGILDLSKIEAGKVELDITPVDIGALVRETALELEGQLQGRDVKLIAAVPEGLNPIETDQAKIKQIVINLVGNALKFTEKGTVTVRVFSDERSKRPTRIDIVDTGVGIPTDRLEAIFEAFKQADSSTARVYGGTGLGLTITRSLALLMGFDVRVQSTLGAGSTFSILLEPWDAPGADPKSTAERAALSPPEAVERETTNRPLLTLVIDDDADARILLGQHLLELGCDVVSASSADEGMALARRLRPDVITLDVMMPRKNGLVALQEFKADAMLRDIPVVMISVVAEENRAKARGAAEVLDKPVTPDALKTALTRHIDAGLIAGLRPRAEPTHAGAA
jgi:CheY-like chemotaxis protein/nitrogen-specific signal transduction histidine kinase